MNQQENYISLSQFCESCGIEKSFIQTLNDHGLIETVLIEQQDYIAYDDIGRLEKFVRFHYEMEINVEGIEAISNLLERIENLQTEVQDLKRKLDLYKGLV
ncbi:chaperone modulator CbpM [Negadavirga shengliensis]|uniref:Chaperone modulator CbpM n=1 Tax=Negadavirga shengliensis TaxID=1389218 RepID=A0ABV9T641_9BACT